jgi:hypothetical protein
MGGFSPSISPENLNARAGCAAAPLIVDVRRAASPPRERGESRSRLTTSFRRTLRRIQIVFLDEGSAK